MQYWSSEAIYEVNCPNCGKSVEFYKDDTNRRCHHCGNRFVNPKMDFGCAAYCQYAEQCLGTLPEEFAGAQENLLKDKVAVEMKRHFKADFHRIAHATRVARYAEAIGKSEGGNLPALVCAAYLHDIAGASGADSITTMTAAARNILCRLQAKEPMIDAVTVLLERQNEISAGSSLEQQILDDAINLALLEEACKQQSGDSDKEPAAVIQARVKTAEGRQQAQALLGKYRF
jgi:HD superfamily phosphodiesterase/DNA-directed RNA polymerase subunit RPC12/RpoP